MARTISGFQGLVQAPEEAGRFHRLSAPRILGSSSFALTSGANRVMTIAPGTILVCGVRFNESAATTITLPAATATTLDVVGLRFTWTSTGGTVALFTKRGTSTAYPALDRRPGIVYEVPLYGIRMTSGVSTVASTGIFDVRVNGGIGGPFLLNTSAIQSLSNNAQNLPDLPHGSLIKIGTALFQVWTVDGAGNITTLLLDTTTGAWRPFTPTLRDGFGSACGLGTLGSAVGRYKVMDGYCHIKVSIGAAGSGVSMGVGQLSIDLPVAAAAFDDHPFGDGRMYTVVGDGSYNWPVKISFRTNYGLRGKLFSVGAGNDARIAPLQAFIQGSNPARGYPYIGPAGTLTLPSTLNIDAEYMIAN